mmetsp:Transcript_23587/g.30589  ORF Transcript_23587/g.30589 Transcript_23587/m.30589 type:complete len:215 (+) Transcript_23587:4093-4737(+)
MSAPSSSSPEESLTLSSSSSESSSSSSSSDSPSDSSWLPCSTSSTTSCPSPWQVTPLTDCLSEEARRPKPWPSLFWFISISSQMRAKIARPHKILIQSHFEKTPIPVADKTSKIVKISGPSIFSILRPFRAMKLVPTQKNNQSSLSLSLKTSLFNILPQSLILNKDCVGICFFEITVASPPTGDGLILVILLKFRDLVSRLEAQKGLIDHDTEV